MNNVIKAAPYIAGLTGLLLICYCVPRIRENPEKFLPTLGSIVGGAMVGGAVAWEAPKDAPTDLGPNCADLRRIERRTEHLEREQREERRRAKIGMVVRLIVGLLSLILL